MPPWRGMIPTVALSPLASCLIHSSLPRPLLATRKCGGPFLTRRGHTANTPCVVTLFHVRLTVHGGPFGLQRGARRRCPSRPKGPPCAMAPPSFLPDKPLPHSFRILLNCHHLRTHYGVLFTISHLHSIGLCPTTPSVRSQGFMVAPTPPTDELTGSGFPIHLNPTYS